MYKFYNAGIMEEQVAFASVSALAQTLRLRIFRALVGASPQGLKPGALSATLELPASALSIHLKTLMQAQLMTQRRDGRSLIYSPALDQMSDLLAHLSAHCCEGQPGAALPAESGRQTC